MAWAVTSMTSRNFSRSATCPLAFWSRLKQNGLIFRNDETARELYVAINQTGRIP